MTKKILKISLLHLNWMTKLLLIMAIMVMSATGALMIRLKKGPLDLEFVKAEIEQALSDDDKGYQIKIGSAALTWPEVAAPLLVNLKGVNMMEADKPSLSMGELSFSVSGMALLKGKILPSRIIIDKPAFRLFNKDGSFNTLSGSAKSSHKNVYGPVRPQNVQEELKNSLAKIVDPKNQEIDALSALKKIEINEAVLQDGEGTPIALVTLHVNKHDLGLAGNVKVTYPKRNEKIAHFKSDVLYRRHEGDLTFTATLKDLHTSHIAPFVKNMDMLLAQDLFLNGDLKAAFDKNLNLQMAMLDLNMPEGNFVVKDIYEEPIPFKDILLKAQYNADEKILDIKDFTANVGNITVSANSKVAIEKDHIVAPVVLKIPELKPGDVVPIFPKSHLESTAGEWLTKKVSNGRLHDIVLNTNFHVLYDLENNKRDMKMTDTKVKFQAEGVTVQYLSTLKPVTDVIAEGSFENDTLIVKGKSGNIGDIVGQDIVVKISNLSVTGGGLAEISLKAKAPLKSAFDYIKDEPIGVRDLGFDVADVKGNVDFGLDIRFPTLKDLPKEEVKVVLNGKAHDIFLPNIVQGLPLTGGPYDLAFKDGAITLNGKGQIGGKDIDLSWFQYFNPAGRDFESKLTAKVIADAELRQKFGIGLTDYLSGSFPIDITYIDKGVKATIDVKGNLTPATLHIKPFDFAKNSGVAGDLSLTAHMNGEDLKQVTNLNIKTNNFNLLNGRLVFKKLKDGSFDVAQGSFPHVTIGKTKTAIDFENANDNVMKVVAKGSIFDMTPFLSTDKKKATTAGQNKNQDNQPMKISLAADKMLGEKGEFVRNAQLYLELDKDAEPTRIEMDANVGKGVMNIRFKPDATGVRNFRMESTDAGHTLKVFGLYDKMRGGNISISGQPKGGTTGSDLFGQAQITDFNIKQAPALAKLMSMMSIKGVEGLVTGESGVSFSKLASNFEWKFKEDGNLLVMKEGRTSGNALGLTFEGFVNMQSGLMDLSGTVIPLSGVNKAISEIPLIGNILTGGEALFAATYSMKGPSNDPQVSMNPLSVLAPGFLRQILFEGDVDAKVKREENKR